VTEPAVFTSNLIIPRENIFGRKVIFCGSKLNPSVSASVILRQRFYAFHDAGLEDHGFFRFDRDVVGMVKGFLKMAEEGLGMSSKSALPTPHKIHHFYSFVIGTFHYSISYKKGVGMLQSIMGSQKE